MYFSGDSSRYQLLFHMPPVSRQTHCFYAFLSSTFHSNIILLCSLRGLLRSVRCLEPSLQLPSQAVFSRSTPDDCLQHKDKVPAPPVCQAQSILQGSLLRPWIQQCR